MKTQKYLTLMLSVFTMVPLLLVMTVSALYFGENDFERLKANADSNAKNSCDNINQFFLQRKMALEVASDLPDVKGLLSYSNQGVTGLLIESKRTDVIETFKTMTLKQTMHAEGDTKGNYVRRSSLINRNNEIIASDDGRLIGQKSIINKNMQTVPAYGCYVSELRRDPNFINGQTYFILAVPIYSDGIYEGFIQSSIDMYYFNLLSSQTFMGTGHTYILDQNGNFAQDNLVEMAENKADNIQQIKFSDGFDWRKIDLSKNPSGLVRYQISGKGIWGYYSRITGTDWVVVNTVTQAELFNPYIRIILIYLFALLLLAVFVFRSASRAAKRFSDPVRDLCAAFLNVEQRDYSIRLNGCYKGEFSNMASAFNRLVEKIQADTDELKVSEARYALIMEETDQVIFDWDIQQNHLYHTVHWTNKFGFSVAVENPGAQIPNFTPVHPDDRELLNDFFSTALEGCQPEPVDVRMKTIDSRYIWCTVRIKIIFDENRKPFRAIGLISDTDHQKKIIQNLENKSRTDLLTQLYNKVTTEVLIDEFLRNSPQNQHHGFVIVDIDNFKAINDTCGHYYGDTVLKKVSQGIKNLFRLSDIVGRAGGDEFIILVKDLPRDEHLKLKLQDICEVFRSTHTGKNGEYAISASIGAAFYPEDGTSFTTLYRNADLALYRSKREGKNRYTLYSDESLKNTS
jgi:diguanylate cyclase (GGDEF)-like protein/PAS domain S-box-containing protein